MKTVTIPVMAKCRIGHFAEAQILQTLEVDFIDESEGKYSFSIGMDLPWLYHDGVLLSSCL